MNTGQRLWNFDTIPSAGEAAKTWPDDPSKFKARGGTYSSYALDTESGLLYSAIGNREYRWGDNLYTSSAVAGKNGYLYALSRDLRDVFF